MVTHLSEHHSHQVLFVALRAVQAPHFAWTLCVNSSQLWSLAKTHSLHSSMIAHITMVRTEQLSHGAKFFMVRGHYSRADL